MAERNNLEGGFLPQTLPSPAPSNKSNSLSQQSPLPHPRKKALRPGGNLQERVRNQADRILSDVSRRLIRKGSGPSYEGDSGGYMSVDQLCKDLDGIINTLWLSGTRMGNTSLPF